MNREFEKIYEKLDEFLEGKEIHSDEEYEEAVAEFMSMYNSTVTSFEPVTEKTAKTADDFMELAEDAPTKKEALRLARKAAALDKENIDVQLFIAELSSSTNDQLLEKLNKLLDKAEAKLTKEGYFDEEYIGDFWLIYETRPYMRARDKYLDTLIEGGRYRAAERECREMLRLCTNDNLGVRYRLMHLYAFFEDELSAVALWNQYENENSTQFLLPLSILYYKTQNMEEAEKYLRMLNDINGDTKLFFRELEKGDLADYLDEDSLFGYSFATIDEFFFELMQNGFLLTHMASYFQWGSKKLKAIK